jgi:hypothetical protein
MSRTSTSRSLHHCPNCSSDLVQPVEWEPSDADRWSVLLRCPECEVYQSGVFSQPDVDGALVGGASLDPEGFARIVAAVDVGP